MIDFSKIQAVIFDMDGVLINSEPMWKKVETAVFASVGIDFEAVGGEKTVGLRIDEVIDYWFGLYPWKNKTKQEVVDEILVQMEHEILNRGEEMTGVTEALQFFKSKSLKIGLASSSFERLIHATLTRLGLSSYFDVVLSAEHLDYGKPHPSIYLEAANQLEVDPLNCLVIEDSLNGVIAGKAAKMNVVAIPDGTHSPNPKLVLADLQLDSLLELIRFIDESNC